jgi:thioredoxin reductase
MGASTEVAIVGAGPYGLSIAAHLSHRGIAHRIFGIPMDSWRRTMPAGMLLKSEGFASNLYEPQGRFTLEQFCADNGLAYGHSGHPIPLDTMNAYGLAFQKHFVPHLEERMVSALEPQSDGFLLRFDDGETLAARRVVLASGINYFGHVPASLTRLPKDLLSHSCAHGDLTKFRGMKLAVVGAGASAIDIAGLAAEAGASVELIARRPKIKWLAPPSTRERSLWEKVRYPESGLGAGLRSRFYEEFPMLFRRLPQRLRLQIVSTFLGPAPPAWMKDKVEGRMPVWLGWQPIHAAEKRGKAHLRLRAVDGEEREIVVDHVVAATGFRVDLRGLPYLADSIRQRIRTIEGAPRLSGAFETSVAGLHFAGLPAANTFGPVMRFMIGADYTARRLARHLAGAAVEQPVAHGIASVGPARA